MAEKRTSYRGTPYWETEQPQVADSKKVRLSYYSQAGKMQVSQVWQDKATGELRKGRTITLDQEDMQLHPETLKLLEKIIQEWS